MRAAILRGCAHTDEGDMPDFAPRAGVTAALADLQRGVAGAADRLAELVYDELHGIAVGAMRRENDGHTLQPTELVDEAFVRLIGQTSVDWQSRAQFFAVAARIIRRILVDHARARHRQKRDHGIRVTLDESIAGATEPSLDLIALDDALKQLETLAPRQAQVVEMRFFGGLEIVETAEALGISAATVKRDWTFARAFLLRTMDAHAV
jgi:RNA polymerase sigma factor (TIGR02999 family)